MNSFKGDIIKQNLHYEWLNLNELKSLQTKVQEGIMNE